MSKRRGSFYWAYGRNLSVAAMRQRCPRAVKVGPLVVHDARLIFRGVADITLAKGEKVQGGLWWISDECEERLDRFEGAASKFYLKRHWPRLRAFGREAPCLFYQMQVSEGVMPPTQEYYDAIRRGYIDFGLDVEALDDAVAAAYADKEVTPLLRRRHEARGKPRLARLKPEECDPLT